MSDQQQATELKPLWTDEMIRYEVEGWQLNCIESEIPVVQDLMKKMRGPYEAERATLTKNLSAADALYHSAVDAIAKLEAESEARKLLADIHGRRMLAAEAERDQLKREVDEARQWVPSDIRSALQHCTAAVRYAFHRRTVDHLSIEDVIFAEKVDKWLASIGTAEKGQGQDE